MVFGVGQFKNRHYYYYYPGLTARPWYHHLLFTLESRMCQYVSV